MPLLSKKPASSQTFPNLGIPKRVNSSGRWYYLLAEEFDRDPFLLFHLRGIEREEMAQLIDAAPIAGAAKASIADDTAETLPTDIASFWRGTAITGSRTRVTPPASPAPVAQRLEGVAFLRGGPDVPGCRAPAIPARNGA